MYLSYLLFYQVNANFVFLLLQTVQRDINTSKDVISYDRRIFLQYICDFSNPFLFDWFRKFSFW